jgi:cell division septation protein DedD
VPPPPDPYAVSLVVQVGSFLVQDNATRLAESLRQLGYPAEIVQRTDSHQRSWYVLRLGPYRQWNAASDVAAKLAVNQELKPIVGPM